MFEGLKDMGKLMKQAKEMRDKMKKVQDELKHEVVKVQSDNGKIKIEFSGELECISLQIDPELLKEEKIERVSKLLQQVINKGTKEAKELATKKLSAISGDLNLPGM